MIWSELAICAATAFLLASGTLAFNHDAELNVDEAYVWYGALRTLERRVPIRDFRAYEPGRYYWCALWMRLFGSGIFAFRIATHAFLFIGLSAALFGLRVAETTPWPAVVVAGILLCVWASPFQRFFEPSLLMIAFLAGTLVLAEKSPIACFFAGLAVGGTAFFASNYFIYVGAGLSAIVALESWKGSVGTPYHNGGTFLLGCVIGALPLIAMFLFEHGFLNAFYRRRIMTIVSRGSSNLFVPVPWPWRPLPPAWSSEIDPMGARFGQLLLFLTPLLCWAIAIGAVLTPTISSTQAGPVSAAVLGSFAVHHSFSRADPPHLAFAIPPLLLSSFSAFAACESGLVLVAAVFTAGTMATAVSMHPQSARQRYPQAYIRTDAFGDNLWLRKSQVELYLAVRTFLQIKAGTDTSLLAVPTLVAVYPLLGLRSPVYDTFCVYPAAREEQERMMREIDTGPVLFALVQDVALDGNEALRFSHTHPLVWSKLHTEFVPLEAPAVSSNQGMHLFARK